MEDDGCIEEAMAATAGGRRGVVTTGDVVLEAEAVVAENCQVLKSIKARNVQEIEAERLYTIHIHTRYTVS